MSEILPGASYGPFVIDAPLGAGGMGRVFRATDTRLGRAVALKFIRAGIAHDPDTLERFRREARAASAINHPNICSIYEFGEAHGETFIAMELLEGESLASRLDRGPLPVRDALALARDLADALDAAHGAGVLHRDLKPANVFLTSRGHVKLLDFGLAKDAAVDRADSESPTRTQEAQLTRKGSTIGTIAYMSPEQARGEPLDPRSDLFSLGSVLYEALTGTRAFAGATEAVVFDAILNRMPPLPSSVRPECPPAVDALIERLLAKDRAARYGNASKVRDELATLVRALDSGEHLSAAALKSAPSRPRRLTAKPLVALAALAVVVVSGVLAPRFFHPTLRPTDTVVLADFRNATSQPLLSSALQQALTIALGKSPFLSIVPRERVVGLLPLMRQPSDAAITLPIGRLAAGRTQSKAVIQGSVETIGSQYVIGLQAVNATTGDLIAAEQEQVPRVEDLVTSVNRLAMHMRAKLGESLASIRATSVNEEFSDTGSLECLDALNKGWEVESTKGSAAAIPIYLRAVQADSNCVAARLSLGVQYANVGDTASATRQLRFAYARRDSIDLRERLMVEGFYAMHVHRDDETSAARFLDVVNAYPRERFGPLNLAVEYSCLGRLEDAARVALHGVLVDTTVLLAKANYAAMLFAAGRMASADSAVATLASNPDAHNRVVRLRALMALVRDDRAAVKRIKGEVSDPDEAGLPNARELAVMYGRPREFWVLTEQAVAQSGTAAVADRRWLYCALSMEQMGAHAQASAALAKLGGSIPRDADPMWVAYVQATIGDPDRAMALARSAAARWPLGTLAQRYDLPCVEAAVALRRGDAAGALARLEATRLYELGASYSLGTDTEPIWLRARAYEALGRWAEADAEYQRLVDRRCLTVPTVKWPLGMLGVARCEAKLGHVARARAAYEEVIHFWRDAEPDYLLLQQARAESQVLAPG